MRINVDRVPVKIVNVTPELAKRFLGKNIGNRSISTAAVAFLVEEMKSDRFILTNDAVAFNTKGELINGQHRLTAVAQSGISCPFIVMDNVDEAMKEVIDLGRSRSIPDMLKMLHGQDRSRLVTGAIRILDQFVDNRKIKLSVGHALEQIAKYDAAFKWAVDNVPGQNQFGISAIVAALVYAHRSQPTGVEEFARRLFAGSGLTDQSAVLLFREYVHGRRGLFTTSEDKRECFILCLVAIDKHLRGSRVKQLRRRDEVISEFGAAYKQQKQQRMAG